VAQVVAGTVSVAATAVAGWSGQCDCEAVSAVEAVSVVAEAMLLRRDNFIQDYHWLKWHYSSSFPSSCNIFRCEYLLPSLCDEFNEICFCHWLTSIS
jgi:hypothetical protein